METVYNGNKGVVSIIDCNNYTLIKNLITGTQPHGIAIDDAKGLVYVSHRNIDVTVPLPHHTSVCGGRNGYLTYIDLNTLNLTGRRIELSADSYSIAIRP